MRAALLVLLVAGCFNPNAPRLAPCDTDEECPSSQTCRFGLCSDNDDHGARIGFAEATSLEDELSGTVMVSVVLDHPALVPVTVDYSLAGGTATEGVDYTFTQGTLTFAAGETEQAFPLTITLDAEEESDETIELAIGGVSGGVLGVTATHTITISANVLARVGFSLATDSAQESVPGMVEVSLDAPSGLTVTVNYSVAGTATDGGIDHSLAAGTLVFAPGETTKQLPLGVVDDPLDEDDETVIVTIDTVDNGKLGANPTETYTILDNDATPTVQFTTASSSIVENTTTVSMSVTLSAASGRTVTVDFATGVASTATAASDYNYNTSSPLTFTAGQTSRSIVIAVIEDTVPEFDETVITNLANPVNATLGGITTRTLTITDDDHTCYGSGAYTACVKTPTTAVSIGASLNTDTSGLCQATQPLGWSGQGQPPVCAVVGTTIDVAGTTTVTGSRALILVATDITIGGSLDVSSRRGGTPGPGSPSGSCGAFPVAAAGHNGGGGGGAGGSFVTRGGNGGSGDAGQGSGGVSVVASAAPNVLRAGCDGQLAGKSSNDNPGAIGRGGGAVFILATNSLTITGSINASGSGATLGAMQAGGSGAGSGGMIKLEAAVLTITGATLIANGGGGASGGGSFSNGASGGDPSVGTPFTPAAGGFGGGGAGGTGYASGSAALPGSNAVSNSGGGGGGGGGGFIQSNLTLAGANVSAGVISAP